jgi:cytochrome P450
MLASGLLPILSAYWPLILVAGVVIRLFRNKYHNGLNKYPGNALASYTNWWRYFDVRGRRAQWTHIDLHRKHGDIVRLGPNVLSFADPRAIKTIYGLNKGMTKASILSLCCPTSMTLTSSQSEFYPVQTAIAKGRPIYSLFSTTDEGYHAKYRRCVNSAFSMSSLVNYEPLVDSTTDAFIEQTQKRYLETGKTCDFAQWLQFFAFDVIGDLTWSKRLGFVEKNEDVDGIVEFIGRFLAYAGPVGQMPLLDLVWQKNPARLAMERFGLTKTVFPVTQFAQKQSAARETEMKKVRETGEANETSGKGVDLLTKFTQAQHDHPEFMTDQQVLASCNSMVFAGSETTAISLSSVFYNLVKHPKAYKKLMEELDDAARTGAIVEKAYRKVGWKESQTLPYLDAVIQESFRLHPAPGLILERILPPQGMDILGEHIPGGTIVGCNAWVVHRRPEIFGEDVDVFRPERWLEASPAQLKEMKATMFQFGAGARTCIGKNIR